ncbi:hypothetical protein GCM10007380_33720 [Gottfriedia solisilvae]|uniref:Uncharacterized protein n=2 Tax=Gottfriedia solisilvae TaxID=1516104 RepID=A0A8J3APR3_9BACI|nr:hypothetical protein GCM10007380_33720 [Gottfriedia solisilvae]
MNGSLNRTPMVVEEDSKIVVVVNAVIYGSNRIEIVDIISAFLSFFFLLYGMTLNKIFMSITY